MLVTLEIKLAGYPRNNAYFPGWKEASRNNITDTMTTLEEYPLQLMMEFDDDINVYVVIKCDGVRLLTINAKKYVLFGESDNYLIIASDVSVVLCTIFIDKDDNLCVICESQEAKFSRYTECYQNYVPLTVMSLDPGNQDNVYYRTLHSLNSKQRK